MKVSEIDQALIRIVQAREAHMRAAFKAEEAGVDPAKLTELGFVAGLKFALNELEAAGLHVRSAEYIATGR